MQILEILGFIICFYIVAILMTIICVKVSKINGWCSCIWWLWDFSRYLVFFLAPLAVLFHHIELKCTNGSSQSGISVSISKLCDISLLPPASVVCEGHVFAGVCLSTKAGGVVSQHALQVSRPTLGGLQTHTQGGSPGPHLGGVSRPTPMGVYPSMYWDRHPAWNKINMYKNIAFNFSL